MDLLNDYTGSICDEVIFIVDFLCDYCEILLFPSFSLFAGGQILRLDLVCVFGHQGDYPFHIILLPLSLLVRHLLSICVNRSLSTIILSHLCCLAHLWFALWFLNLLLVPLPNNLRLWFIFLEFHTLLFIDLEQFLD